MRVDPGEVEFSCDKEENGPHGCEARVAAGLAFGGLEEAIQGFDEAVGLPGLGPRHDAFEMRAYHLGDILHRRDLGAQDVGAPCLEHGGDNVDLLAVEDVTQMLAVQPGAGGTFAGGRGDQRIEIGAAFFGKAATVLE